MTKNITTWQDFARETVLTHDLDPMYDFLYTAGKAENKGYDWAYRFALHFFMFYHAGEAIQAASYSNEKFWDYTLNTYDKVKRGTERRHFRSDKGFQATKRIKAKGLPLSVWMALQRPEYEAMMTNIKRNFIGCEIGPYFAWKAMDLLDRGLGLPVYLTLAEAAKYMPDEPRKCAATLWPDKPIPWVLEEVKDAIHDLPAPGCPDRNCSFPEAETVLCMLKGYFITKTHVIGDDIAEKHAQLAAFPEYLQFLPPKIDLNDYQRGPLDTPTLSA